MTYAIRVECNDAGECAVVAVAGDVPPGAHEINGHDDGTNRNIQVVRRDENNRFVTWASHYKHPEES